MNNLNNLDLRAVIHIIANGHTYTKHVRGIGTDTPGINEFNSSARGPNLNIKSPTDLENYLHDFLKKEGTIGFEEPNKKGIYRFYNPTENVFLAFNTRSREDRGIGSAFRPKDGESYFTRLHTHATQNGKIEVPLSKTPEEIIALAERFPENIKSLPDEDKKRLMGRIEKERSLKPHTTGNPVRQTAKSAVSTVSKATKIGKSLTSLTKGFGTAAKVLGPVAIAAAAAEAIFLGKEAQAAVTNGTLSKNAMAEYSSMLATHAIQVAFDPTVVLGEIVIHKWFESFAKRHNLPPSLKEMLEPTSILYSGNTRMDAETKLFLNIFDKIPDSVNDEMSPELQTMVQLKQQITAAEQKLENTQRTIGTFKDSKALDIMETERNLQEARMRYIKQYEEYGQNGALQEHVMPSAFKEPLPQLSSAPAATQNHVAAEAVRQPLSAAPV